MSSQSLKNKLQNQELTIGSWISLAHPAIAEIFCKAGYDWLTIDLEHSVISLKETEELIRIIDLHGVTPLVRLSSINETQVKRVLDSGAKGVIVPNIKNAHEVKTVHSWMNYPDQGGHRGVGLARAQAYGPGFKNYMSNCSNELSLIVQIESAQALENIDEILSCPEVDAFMVGPYDLSASLGIPGEFDHPKLKEALNSIYKAGKHHGKSSGTHVVEPNPEELSMKIEEGLNFIAYSVDFRMLDTCARSGTVHKSK